MGNVHMEATQINYREGDKKMSVAQAIKNAGNTGLAHMADIAPEFSAETAYNAGDFVYHNGSLYEFTANHAAGAWSTADTQAAAVGGKITSLMGGLTNNSVNLTTSGLFQIINQGSHMITSGVLHVFAKIKCIALPAEGANDFDFVLLPSGMEIITNQRGIIITVGKASSEWVTPSNLVYGYIGTSSISGHTSDLTVNSYYFIDVIIKLATN